MRSVAIGLTLLALGSAAFAAQSPAPAPAFEVASVKQNVSGETRTYFNRPPGVSYTNITLRALIVRAFGIEQTIERFTLQGGPEKILSARFNVTAKEPEGAPAGQTMLMLRTLLAERFNLKVHTETRQMPIYAAVVAREGKLGSALRPTPHDCVAFAAAGGKRDDDNAPRAADNRPLCFVSDSLGGGGALTIRSAAPLAQLLNRVQGFVDRPVSDATGLTGSFEWELTFSMREQTLDGALPSIYTALPEQLGLKLEPGTGPVEVLVIDSVEMPTPD
jgi:uncharacterized protein (TIGR03435 family)